MYYDPMWRMYVVHISKSYLFLRIIAFNNFFNRIKLTMITMDILIEWKFNHLRVTNRDGCWFEHITMIKRVRLYASFVIYK